MIAASYLFYGWWDWRFLILIFVSSLADYIIGQRLHLSRGDRSRRVWLAASLGVNLGILGFFKYFNFFIDSFADLVALFGMDPHVPTLRIVLPVGISFYTFQTLSYTLDIYRRELEPTRNAAAFFAFVSFFPQLVAGPIERARDLLPQFTRERRFDGALARDGLRQMLWGFVKKMVIADTVSPHVEAVYGNWAQHDGATVVLATFFFAVQIYCDFSGYSDIAIGTARLFGFSLRRNFAFPYFSRDIGEFWRRWHISLSSWFRDYVFIPLGGSRCGTARQIWNICVTFTVSGLWHGANWTFVIWGALNGLYYLPLMLRGKQKQWTGNAAEGRLLPGLREGAAMLLTFALTLLAWVFFRAESLTHALSLLGRIFGSAWAVPDADRYGQALVVALAGLLVEWLQRDKQHALDVSAWPVPVRWATYLAAGAAVVVLGSFGSSEFIYFQF
jgi:D-alanyl-lipoteichoic acid acyltransferase DltB (MBOAT superfamily)